jgi:hypothetical protein
LAAECQEYPGESGRGLGGRRLDSDSSISVGATRLLLAENVLADLGFLGSGSWQVRPESASFKSAPVCRLGFGQSRVCVDTRIWELSEYLNALRCLCIIHPSDPDVTPCPLSYNLQRIPTGSMLRRYLNFVELSYSSLA